MTRKEFSWQKNSRTSFTWSNARKAWYDTQRSGRFNTDSKNVYRRLGADDYDALPGDFYVKAYLKQYAERLDLDYDQLVTAYERNEPIDVHETPDLTENYRFVKPSERLEADEDELGNKKWRYYLPIVLLGTVAALIIISISAAVILNKPKSDGISDHLYSLSTSSK